jgi:hypothetical protein
MTTITIVPLRRHVCEDSWLVGHHAGSIHGGGVIGMGEGLLTMDRTVGCLLWNLHKHLHLP